VEEEKMRTIIIGGPRCGKSTLARTYRAQGIPTYCGDPRSLVKEPEDGVTYLPEGLVWRKDHDEGSQYVIDHWFPMPGPWLLEGQNMARALRKWVRQGGDCYRGAIAMPCDRIIVLREPRPECTLLPGQESMGKAVATVWSQVGHRFREITEYR
jgi:hypothetical protein